MEMEVRDKILEIVGEYRALPSDYVNINELMYSRKLLATYGANFAVQVGDARARWKRATYKYDITRNQKQIQFYKKQGNLGKSEMYAKANTEELYKDSIDAENEYYQLDYIFKALRETLGELNQRIAYLREELKQDRYFSE